jgi:hypothetical protein
VGWGWGRGFLELVFKCYDIPGTTLPHLPHIPPSFLKIFLFRGFIIFKYANVNKKEKSERMIKKIIKKKCF